MPGYEKMLGEHAFVCAALLLELTRKIFISL